MLHRAAVFLLALLCLFSGSGIAVQQHRCMGTATGTVLAPVSPEEHHRCDRCGMERKASKGCCEDVVKVIKAKETQRFYTTPHALPVLEWVVPTVPLFAPAAAPRRTARAVPAPCSPRPPPGAGGTLPRYLRLRVLRL